jgi:hypothetical protein
VTTPALFGALLHFALRNDRPRTLAVGIPVKAAIFTADFLAHPGIAALVVTLWAALASSLGNGVRSHRAYIAEAEGRARRAERDAEEQARRRVAATGPPCGHGGPGVTLPRAGITTRGDACPWIAASSCSA